MLKQIPPHSTEVIWQCLHSPSYHNPPNIPLLRYTRMCLLHLECTMPVIYVFTRSHSQSLQFPLLWFNFTAALIRIHHLVFKFYQVISIIFQFLHPSSTQQYTIIMQRLPPDGQPTHTLYKTNRITLSTITWNVELTELVDLEWEIGDGANAAAVPMHIRERADVNFIFNCIMLYDWRLLPLLGSMQWPG